ncbi:uncharacterized protein LOC115634563 [Scaptodrosophila lebanonensis]|uniref:Uncharacterized protein LOC115634563 n=1 Tax=Drosophila lebanonensis TaxID=7225 RepID=A0A6J2ULZ0_DROLE|nr:uncharacterized protein LOC115634563 [Scaptodrosophila lebanonensis]
MPRTRTLRRAPEMDADIDDVDVAAAVGVDVKVVDDNVIKNDDDNEDSIDSITQELVNATKPVAKEATAVEVDQAALPMTEQNLDNSKPFKIKDVTRHIRKAMVASTLAELRLKVAVRFERGQPAIHLDCDGTEIDDEEYFSTLEPNAELIAVFPGEQWRDPSDYNANVRRSSLDARRLRKLVNQLQLQQNMLNDADLDTLSNMDPNSLVDITGRDLKDSDYEAARRSTELSC